MFDQRFAWVLGLGQRLELWQNVPFRDRVFHLETGPLEQPGRRTA
jgi:hypothetical protein